MKSRRVNRFLAILGACAMVVTSTPLTASAAESVSGNSITTEESAQDETSDESIENVEKPEEVKAPTAESKPKEEVVTEPVTGDQPNSPIAAATKMATEAAETAAGNTESTGDTPTVGEPPVATNNEDEYEKLPGTSIDPGEVTIPEKPLIPTTPTVEVDEKSGLNVYRPIPSEFEIENGVVTSFNPSTTLAYEAVYLPGTVGINAAKYGTDILEDINKKKKGIIFGEGATLTTSAKDMDWITYVRFDSGAKAASAVSTFEGWENLTSVVGLGEALAANGNTEVSFTKTFMNCVDLSNVELDITGLTASFDNTFSGIKGIGSTRIENGNISSIYYFNYIADNGVDWCGNDRRKRTTTFSGVTFPSNDTDYLSHAFTTMNGSFIFNDCNSDGTAALNFNAAWAGGNVTEYVQGADVDSYTTWEIGGTHNPSSGDQYNNSEIKITGVSAYSAKGMFESASLKNVDLTGLITADTKAVDKMFKGSTIACIKGIDSWRLGPITAEEMFASTRIYYGPNSYLTKTLIPQVKRLDWSKCTSANKLFNFTYKGNCPIDYSGMDLSGVTDMTISGLTNYDFITPAKHPQNYVFEQDTVYSLRAGSTLGGKALDPITVTEGKVSGADMPADTHIYTDIATISITDVASDKEVSTAVVPGYKLSTYLTEGVKFYQDRSLSQPVAMDLVVNSGDTISVYCSLKKDEVERETIEGSDVDFGENPGNVEVTLEDGSKDKLQGGNADVKIKIEDTESKDSGIVIPTEGQKFAKSSFFNIDLIATVAGVDKKITEMNQKATIVLPLPADYETGNVTVLNYHDGYDKAPIVLTAAVDKTAKTVTFETDKFSPYVMLYDDSVETDTVDVTIKWEGDVKDKSGRKDIDLEDVVTYENGSTTTVSAKYIADTTKDETKVTFTYPKALGGSAFKSHTFTSALDIKVENYTVNFDSKTYTYTLLYVGSGKRETINVTVDYSNLTASDYTKHVNEVRTGIFGKANVFVDYKYDDNSDGLASGEFAINENDRVYTVPVEIITQKYDGAKFKEYTNIRASQYSGGQYEDVVDLENLKVSFNPVAADSTEVTRYNFVVKVVDNNNSAKKRPTKLFIDFIASYGSYTRNRLVEVNLGGIAGNTANAYVEFPVTVGGLTMTKLDATTSTATNIGYSSTWDQANMLFKYTLAGATDTEPDPTPTIDPATVSITFVGDIASARPQKVTFTLQDSKNGNSVTKTLNTTFSPSTNYYADTFQRLVNDTYHIASVSGIDATKYKVEYNGLNATATYITQTTPAKPSYTRKVTIKMEDNNNEAGIRPKTMKITVANADGSDTVVSEISVGDSNEFTCDVNVMSATDEYKVKSVAGLPSGYTTSINGLTITCKYKVEKIQKTYKVEWTGDGDNVDKTRPDSVQLTIKNGGSQVQTANVSADTNWTANVSLNKLIKGVEASYTVDGADVSNYSKSVSGDTVTYKFTGTLSKDAAAAEAKKNGTDGTGATGANGEKAEDPTYDIANFDWIDYANRYPDLKKAYGYNKEALYAHYIRYGIGEGRIATFTGKYATVNEDVLRAYFPQDYKYKTNLSATNPEYTIGSTPTTATTTTGSATVSENSVSVDSNGNVHTKVKNEDGTVTETVTDAEGNVISVSTYKTGDLRLEDMSLLFVVLGVLLLAIAGLIVRSVVKDDKRKKTVLGMIS